MTNVVTGMRFPNSTAFCGPMSPMAAFHVSTATKAPGRARYAICGVTETSVDPDGIDTRPAPSATAVAAAIVSQPSPAVSAV